MNSSYVEITTMFNKEQENSKLDFNWTVTNLDDTQIDFQLIFKYPTHVSSNPKSQDKLKVRFLPNFAEYLFSHETNLFCKDGLEPMIKNIPT